MMDISGQTYVATPPPVIKQEEIEQDIKELEERLKPMICEECKSEYCEEELLSCKGCKRFHHTFCLVPPLPSAPSGIWYCSLCIAKVYQPLSILLSIYIHLSIHSSIHPSIHQSIPLFILSIHPLSFHPCVHLSIPMSIYPSLCLSIHPSIHPLSTLYSCILCPSIHPSIHLSNLLSILLSIYLSIPLFIYPCLCLSIY